MRKAMFALIAIVMLWTPAYAQSNATMLQEVRAARALYPQSMSRAEVAELLNRVAWAYRAEGWGLLKKGSGNSCPLKDVFVSCDILIHKGATDDTSIHYDVLQDAENEANPVFNSVGPCVLGPASGCSMNNFLPPFAPSGTVEPEPDPQPVVDHSLDAAILSFIQDVRAAIGRIEQRQDTADSRVAALSEAVEVLLARPVGTGNLPAIVFPTYKGSLFGASITLRPEAK